MNSVPGADSNLAGFQEKLKPTPDPADSTRFKVLGALSFSHFLNDMMQSLMLALYPMLKGDFSLSYAQIGMITLMFQFTASLLQPLVGLYTDRHPKPYALSLGMGFTLVGLLVLAVAPSYAFVLLAAALVGTGSAVFHPESSRIARLASGGRHGMAQSIFQVGGNAGQAMGPLAAAWIIIPLGRPSVGAFSAVALLAIGVLWSVGNWYRAHRIATAGRPAPASATRAYLPKAAVTLSMTVLMVLALSKAFYITSLNSYLTFYLIERFGTSVEMGQFYLFLLLAAVAVGTLLGGLVTDRIGRRNVIWISILGAAPFAMLLPYSNLEWTGAMIVLIGLVSAASFPAIIVYAQDIMPGRVGMVAGLFFGLSFGIGGLGAALLGRLADVTDIIYVYKVCSFILLLGLLTAFLPDIEKRRHNAGQGGNSR
ncbi:MAG: MFS transporter [Betaproteobacteria bacterium]|nr:MFS transporter [Betaproteobacteria bacterium]